MHWRFQWMRILCRSGGTHAYSVEIGSSWSARRGSKWDGMLLLVFTVPLIMFAFMCLDGYSIWLWDIMRSCIALVIQTMAAQAAATQHLVICCNMRWSVASRNVLSGWNTQTTFLGYGTKHFVIPVCCNLRRNVLSSIMSYSVIDVPDASYSIP